MSVNLSNAYLRAVNSSRKGLYFSSEVDVLFDANAMGCNCVTSFPPGRVDLILCARML